MFISEEKPDKELPKENISFDLLAKVFSTYRRLRLNSNVQAFIQKSSLELALFDSMDLGVYLIDYKTGTYAFTNRTMERMLGVKHGELNQMPVTRISEFIHPADFNSLVQLSNKAAELLKKMKPAEREQANYKVFYRIKHPEGGYCWCLQTNKIIKEPGDSNELDLGLLICLPEHHIVDKVAGFIKTPNRSFEISISGFDGNPISKLSHREQQVLMMVAKGLSSREVSDTLGLSEETIKIHRKKILKKLEVSSSIQAVRLLQKYGKAY